MKNRIIALLLIIVTCLSAVTSCSKKEDICGESGSDQSESFKSTENVENYEDTDMQTETTNPSQNTPDKELKVSVIKNTDIDKLLARSFDYGVPTAFSEGLFATYSAAWGFQNDKVLATGNSDGFGLPIEIKIDGMVIEPTEPIWMPSHVYSVYDSAKSYSNITSEATVSATFTSQYDKDGIKHLTDGVISYADEPRNRWSNYVNPVRTDREFITFDFNEKVTCGYFSVYCYDDGGATRLPKQMSVEYFDGTKWTVAKNQSCGEIAKNSCVEIKFDEFKAESARLVLTPQADKAMGITEIKLYGKSNSTALIPDGVLVAEKKFITENDMVVSCISVKNSTSKELSFEILATPNKGLTEEKYSYRYILFGSNADGTSKKFSLQAGQSAEYRFAVAVADKKGECQTKIDAFLADKNAVENHVKQFNAWFEKNIPYFDCDDKELLQIYYFRWLTYRNNIRKITDEWNGFIISEFLPNVWWSGLYNSISCPAGHHFYEGRWIRDSKYLDSYADFWFIDGANPRLYSFSIADAYYNRYLVTGDKQDVLKYYNSLNSNYAAWEKSHYVSSLGLFEQIADRDGMEKGIGGDGVRPTINSYMYGDAVALQKIALMLNDTAEADKYKAKAENLQKNVMEKLWNETESFFETISTSGKSVNVRELIGYVPWYFNLPDDDEKYSAAFKQLLDTQGFKAEYGPTTAERRDPEFMVNYTNGCCWNGPSWPFATAQTLTASANLLNNYKNNTSFNKGDWFDLLKTYTKSHYKNGNPWIAENLHPITGEWIVDKDRSIHYNHSSYTDTVITGLVGIRPADNDKTLVVNPLLEEGDLKYFMLENVSYRGHDITVIYDADGSHYNVGKGLLVYVDGKLSASSDKITSLNVKL